MSRSYMKDALLISTSFSSGTVWYNDTRECLLFDDLKPKFTSDVTNPEPDYAGNSTFRIPRKVWGRAAL